MVEAIVQVIRQQDRFKLAGGITSGSVISLSFKASANTSIVVEAISLDGSLLGSWTGMVPSTPGSFSISITLAPGLPIDGDGIGLPPVIMSLLPFPPPGEASGTQPPSQPPSEGITEPTPLPSPPPSAPPPPPPPPPTPPPPKDGDGAEPV